MKPLRFAPSVEAEIEAAGDYYEDQRPGLGSELACMHARREPGYWRSRDQG